MQITDEYREKVLSVFFENDRLIQIPVKRKKRFVVLERILEAFEWDREYSEREVSEIIERFHEDYCFIRREFICEKMMVREDGVYHRIKY